MASLYSRRSVARDLGLLGCVFPLLASGSHAATRPRVHRIGFLIGEGYPELVAVFNDELRRLGYVAGDNLTIETRLSKPDRSNLAASAAELAFMDLELVVAASLPLAAEVKKANPAMPMVIATCAGMVSNGFAQSIERPGGNVTGLDELPPGLTAKRLTLLKTAAPSVSRVALLSTTGGRGGHEMQLADAEEAATALGVSVKPYLALTLPELEAALTAIAADKMDGLVNFQGGLSLGQRQRIVDFAASHRIPAIYQATLFAEAGGLMAWAPDLPGQYREAARYVDQILKGASPGDLPIKYPPRYFLIINARTAYRLGLTMPASLLASADRVLA